MIEWLESPLEVRVRVRVEVRVRVKVSVARENISSLYSVPESPNSLTITFHKRLYVLQ